MIRLGVFLAFFFAAFFVPAWLILLIVGVLYLIGWLLPDGRENPPDDNEGGDSPEPGSPIDGELLWKPFRWSFQSSSKPFFCGTKRQDFRMGLLTKIGFYSIN
jgi:hypothetical protein